MPSQFPIEPRAKLDEQIAMPRHSVEFVHSHCEMTTLITEKDSEGNISSLKLRHAYEGHQNEQREEIVASFSVDEGSIHNDEKAKEAVQEFLKSAAERISSCMDATRRCHPLQVVEELTKSSKKIDYVAIKQDRELPEGIAFQQTSPWLGDIDLNHTPTMQICPPAPHEARDALTGLHGYPWLLGGRNLRDQLSKRNNSMVFISVDLQGAGVLDKAGAGLNLHPTDASKIEKTGLSRELETNFKEFQSTVKNELTEILKTIAAEQKPNKGDIDTKDSILIGVSDQQLKELITVTRPGGDEFTILLPDLSDGSIKRVLTRLQTVLNEKADKDFAYKKPSRSMSPEERAAVHIHNEKLKIAQTDFAKKNGYKTYAKRPAGAGLGYGYLSAVRFNPTPAMLRKPHGKTEPDTTLISAFCLVRDFADSRISTFKQSARDNSKADPRVMLEVQKMSVEMGFREKSIYRCEIEAIAQADYRHQKLVEAFKKEKTDAGKNYLANLLVRNASKEPALGTLPLKNSAREVQMERDLLRSNQLAHVRLGDLFGIGEVTTMRFSRADLLGFGYWNKLFGPASADHHIIDGIVHDGMMHPEDFPWYSLEQERIEEKLSLVSTSLGGEKVRSRDIFKAFDINGLLHAQEFSYSSRVRGGMLDFYNFKSSAQTRRDEQNPLSEKEKIILEVQDELKQEILKRKMNYRLFKSVEDMLLLRWGKAEKSSDPVKSQEELLAIMNHPRFGEIDFFHGEITIDPNQTVAELQEAIKAKILEEQRFAAAMPGSETKDEPAVRFKTPDEFIEAYAKKLGLDAYRLTDEFLADLDDDMEIDPESLTENDFVPSYSL